MDLFFTAVDQCIPKVRKRKNQRAPWISSEIIKLARKKKCMYKRAKLRNCDESWLTYKKVNNLLKKACNEARWEYLNNLANNMHDKGEHKLFWNYVKSRRKGSNDLIVIKLDNGDTLTNEADIVEYMNEYFASVFTTENLESFPSFDSVIEDVELSFLQCSADDVRKILMKLKPRKSPGPDGIHPMILKNCAENLASSLSGIFNSFFASGVMPHNWKLADIIPLHKKGPKKYCKNYRPVSLTSLVCKVCEMIVREQIVQFWINNNIFNPEQFGFLKGKSCLSQLLSSFHDWARERNKGFTTDVIYLDLSKAFDSVPHERLLLKLRAYGIHDLLLSWFRSFLTNRYQRVVLRGHYSFWTPVSSGVPQATVLGPVMFLIYINDISRSVTSQTKLFADDMKVYRVLINTEEDVKGLQNDLTRLQSWTTDWQMKFNTEKCEVMRIQKKTDSSSPHYHLGGDELKVVTEVKDLGIYINSSLSWSLQANKCASKANSILGFIKRTVGQKNPKLFSKLYKTLVRPILEYCSPVWCPYLKKDIDILEKVQRRASRCALGISGRDMSCEERLKYLKWPTLEQRRSFSLLTECYKTINQLNGLDPLEYFTFAHEYRPLRANHRFKLKCKLAKLNCYKYSFFIRIVNDWNKLPREVAESENLNVFKDRLKRYLMHI